MLLSVTGITDLGPNSSGSVLNSGSNGWISLNETLSAGERLVFNSAFLLEVAAELTSVLDSRIDSLALQVFALSGLTLQTQTTRFYGRRGASTSTK